MAAARDTARSKYISADRPAPPHRSPATLLFALTAGALLLVLAGPRALEAVALLPGNATVEKVRQGSPTDRAKLEAAAATRRAANRRVTSAPSWAEEGLIDARLASLAGTASAEGRAFLEASIEAHRAAVALNPAAPYEWARLARAHLLRGGRGPSAAVSLEMSVRTGAYANPDLVFARVEMGLIVWRRSTDELRDLLAEQIRVAARTDLPRLAGIARRTYGGVFVRETLKPDPAVLARFDGFYLRHR